jgi:WD40 repeat protein
LFLSLGARLKVVKKAMFQTFSYPITLKIIAYLICCFLSFPVVSYGEGPIKEPILRLEGQMHTAPILRFATDSANSFFVSSSKDKTLRIWQLPSGRLRKTIRVPIENGSEGELNAVAVSPDGVIIAASGNTCKTWEPTKGYCIYLFDTATGHILSRIKGLPATVLHMSISPKGKYLAVVMSGKAGLRVYQIYDGRMLRSDNDYGDDATWVDFNNSGGLITSSIDGFLRLYDNRFRLLKKKKLAPNYQPYSAQFSPDGEKIAVGFSNRPVVTVFSAQNFEILYFPDATAGVGDFRTVSWSQDGKSLYGAGNHKNSRNSLIRWWKNAGQTGVSGWGEFIDIPVYKSSISQIIALNDGDILYSGLSPVLGGIDNNGFLRFRRLKPTASFKTWQRDFLISADGSVVGFPYDKSGHRSGNFAVRDLQLRSSRAVVHKMYTPLTKSALFSVTGWDGKTGQLKFNGRKFAINESEQINSLAIARHNRFFIVGSTNNLRLYDKSGRGRWVTAVLAPIQGVNISLDNRVIVAAHKDGVIRWYHTANGHHFLSLFPHRDKKRWVVWTPKKLFATSKGGEKIVGWHKNRGSNKVARFALAANVRGSKLKPEHIKRLFAR